MYSGSTSVYINLERDCIKAEEARHQVLYNVASSPGFSLLPRNNLRMTFDPPERKAEGEPGPFSHVIATRIYVRVTRFYVKAALKHGIVTLGTQSDHG